MVHPTIEYMFKPNQDVYRFGNRQFYNRYGMRSPDFAKEKRGNEYRIMVFGDSVVNGGSLTDQEELATTIITGKLTNRRVGQAIVGNISAGSWGPGNWLAYAREYGFFEADVVILVMSSHDACDNPTFEKLNPNTHPTATPAFALVEGVSRYLPRYLPFWRMKNPSSKVNGAALPAKNDARKKGLADLEDFLVLALANSSNVILLQHWEKTEIDNPLSRPTDHDVNAICRRLGVTRISLESYFRKELEQGVSPYFPSDNIHPNVTGQRVIAEVIIKALQKNGADHLSTLGSSIN